MIGEIIDDLYFAHLEMDSAMRSGSLNPPRADRSVSATAAAGIGQTDGSRLHRLLWTVFGSVLGIALLYASTRKVEFTALVDALQTVAWPATAGVLAATGAFIAIKAWRWKMLLRFEDPPSFGELHSAIYAGLAANFLIAHAGEFLRTAIVARKRRYSMSAVFASVLVERTLDFIALLLLLVLVIGVTPDLPAFLVHAGWITAGFVVLGIVGLYSLLQPPAWIERPLQIVLRLLPKRFVSWLSNQLLRLQQGLAALRDVRLMCLAIVVSVLQWSLVIFAIWCSGLAVGANASFVGVTAAFVVIVAGLSLPSSPMQIGTTQLAFVFGLGIDDVPSSVAIAASLIYTAFLILPIMMTGGIILLRGRLSKGLQG